MDFVYPLMYYHLKCMHSREFVSKLIYHLCRRVMRNKHHSFILFTETATRMQLGVAILVGPLLRVLAAVRYEF